MSIIVNVDVSGLNQIIANCDSMPPVIIEEFTKLGEGYAKSMAPVDTGLLMNTLQGFMVSGNLGRIQSDVTYDIYQELGTYKMAAQPFLAPTVELLTGRFLSPQVWQPLIMV